MPISDAKLKDLLVKTSLVDKTKIEAAQLYARENNISLFSSVLEKGFTTESALVQAIASYLKLPFISLSTQPIQESVLNLIPEQLARRYRTVPFARDQATVKVATLDPSSTSFFSLLEKKTGQKILVHLASPSDIEATLNLYQHDLQKLIDNLLRQEIHLPPTSSLEDPPVTKIVDLVINSAYQARASDIHIEPHENFSVVRFRIDGMLREVLHYPKYIHDRIITRVKVMANLRIDEHLSAQDGKISLTLESEHLDIRVSVIPIVAGEKTVLRLLSAKNRQYSLSDLGISEPDLKKITSAFIKAYGMILSTGPTGSGKTTTIYSILKIINSPEKNITTIEDPVEYRIENANQVQVNPKTNLTFAAGLRSLLRQDPNIIFVGEIRDNETAGIAVNAALTGHLVLSTLHTNDAATAVPRLTDMKVEPFLVASTVTVVIAQRLVRQICPACKTSANVSLDELVKNFPSDLIKKHFGSGKNISVSKGQGCKTCRLTGYSGRMGLYEVLEVTPKIRKLIVAKNDSDIIARAAIEEGMTLMIEDGLRKVVTGITTIDEVLRVTKTEFL